MAAKGRKDPILQARTCPHKDDEHKYAPPDSESRQQCSKLMFPYCIEYFLPFIFVKHGFECLISLLLILDIFETL